MKNLKIMNQMPQKEIRLMAASIGMTLLLTGCGFTQEVNSTGENLKTEEVTKKENSGNKKEKIKEGILVIGDEEFLIEYVEIVNYASSDRVEIKLADGTTLNTTANNFYQYDKDSETMNKVKQLVIEEDHIIQ